MNKKWNSLAWVALASFVVAGCSAQGSAETVVINDNVQLESSLADSSLDVSRQQDIEVARKITYSGISVKNYGKQIYFNEKGKFHSLDVETGEERELAEREVMDISDNGNWAISYVDREIYSHNLKNGEMQLLWNGSPEDSTFLGDEVAYFDYSTQLLSVKNMEKGETASWDLSHYPDATISSIQRHGDDVYLAARSEEDGFGIHRLGSKGKITTVVNLDGKDTSSIQFDILQNSSIIFSGHYKGKTGIYYWDEKKNDVQLLVAGGESSEGIWGPSYNLSPDESKILFDTPVQIKDDFKTNVYMAELVDGQLNNSVRIMENANLYSVITYSGDWSEDSKTAYITTVRDTEYIGNIAVFTVDD